MTGDTACSSLRMMLLMFSPSCGIRRGSDRGAPTLINVSRLIFELENYPGLTGWDQSLDRSRGGGDRARSTRRPAHEDEPRTCSRSRPNIERLPHTMRARKLGRGPRGPRGCLL